MPRSLYTLLFMFLAVIFVPAFFNFGNGFLEATCAYALSVLNGVFSLSGWRIGIWIIVTMALYLIVVFLAAQWTYWACMRLPEKGAQIFFQGLILLGFLAWTLRWKFDS
jgi:hypothetical protein